VNARGLVVEATDTSPGWAGTDLPVELAARLALPCAADNDGNAAALGEVWFGAGRDVPWLAMLTLGTGVGGGLVRGGRIVHGAGSMAGTFGHLKVAAGGRRCACGVRGCLEAYASAWAFRRYEGGEPREVFAAASDGDRGAQVAVRRAGEALGSALSDIAHVLNPDLVLVGGGIADGWEALEAHVRRRFAAATLGPAQSTKLAPAGLGADAGIIGGALLTAAWNVSFERNYSRNYTRNARKPADLTHRTCGSGIAGARPPGYS